MFKKIVAVTLAAIIMITPMTASAVTWGAVVAQLNASGSYSGEGVEASVADGAVTVKGSTGATIEGDIDEWNETPTVNIHVGQVGGVNKYSFQDVTINDNVVMNGDGEELEVTFGAGTTVNADRVEVNAFNGGTASFTNEGTINAELGSWGDSSTVSVTNNGTVNGDMGGGFGSPESGPTTGTVTNNGTVTGDMNVYAFENSTVTGVVGKNGVVEGELRGGSSQGDGNATVINDGTVAGMNVWAEQNGETTVVNNGTVENGMSVSSSENSTITMENGGTVGGDHYVSVEDDSTATVTNNGEISGEMAVTASQNGVATAVNNGSVDLLAGGVMAWDDENETDIANEGNASITITNNGTVENHMIVQAWGEGSVTGVNSGDVGGFIVSDAEASGATSNVTNNGTVGGDAYIDAGVDGNAKMNNLGTIGGNSQTEAYGSGIAQNVNNGTVAGDMRVNAYEGGTATGIVGADGVVEGEFGGGSSEGDGTANLTNDGTVSRMNVWIEQDGTSTVTNNGTVINDMFAGVNQNGTLTIENNGEISGEVLYAEARDDSSMTITNNGEIAGGLQISTRHESTSSTTNNGHIGDIMFIEASQNATATGVNQGTIDGTLISAVQDWDEEEEVNIANVGSATSSVVNEGEVGRMLSTFVDGEGTATSVNNGTVHMNINSFTYGGTGAAVVTNNGEVEGDAFVETEQDGSAQLVNNGTIANDTIVSAWGDGSAQMNNLGTIGGENWTQAMDGGVAETVNNGEITGIMGSYVAAGGQTSLVNNGSVPSMTVEFDVNANGESGTTAVTGSGTAGKLNVGVYAAPDVDISTAEARQKIANDVASGLSVYAGQLGLTEGNATVNVVIFDENGEKIDTVEAEVPLEPVPQPEEEYKPSKWEIRHQMEEKRKAESLAGVYASPYWCRQMSLGYRSLNFRVFDAAGKNVLIRERLSWIDGGPRKNLNLRVRTDETEGLTIRFDEEVLEILERTEIDTITLLTYTEKEPFMQYKVSDLHAAFAKFGLARTDLLVIGGMDDEVMKIGADGQMVPVE